MTRLLAEAKTWSSTGAISRSLTTKPGTSALVESDISRSTPLAPSRANPPMSVSRRSSGSWSILKSPVCRMRPAGVRMATARASGIEWLTERNSRSNGPTCCRVPSVTSLTTGVMRCSVSLLLISARVSRDPISGMSARSRSRYVVFEFFKPPSKEHVSMMSEAAENFNVELSPESHDEKVRHAFGRPYTNESMETLIENLIEAGCKRIDLFFMVGLSIRTTNRPWRPRTTATACSSTSESRR